MVSTFAVFDDLVRQGRDSVWTYVARNLSRPCFFRLGSTVSRDGLNPLAVLQSLPPWECPAPPGATRLRPPPPERNCPSTGLALTQTGCAGS
jgi:hypothetical protein